MAKSKSAGNENSRATNEQTIAHKGIYVLRNAMNREAVMPKRLAKVGAHYRDELTKNRMAKTGFKFVAYTADGLVRAMRRLTGGLEAVAGRVDTASRKARELST